MAIVADIFGSKASYVIKPLFISLSLSLFFSLCLLPHASSSGP